MKVKTLVNKIVKCFDKVNKMKGQEFIVNEKLIKDGCGNSLFYDAKTIDDMRNRLQKIIDDLHKYKKVIK